jgi:hypothetical protein
MKFISFGGWLINTRFVVGVGPITKVKSVCRPEQDEGWEIFIQVSHGNDLRTVDKVFPTYDEALHAYQLLGRDLLENHG